MIRTFVKSTLNSPTRLPPAGIKLIALIFVALADKSGAQAVAGELPSTRATPASTVSRSSAKKSTRAAVDCPTCRRPFDQIWVISTRGLGCPAAIDAPPAFSVKRCSPGGSWTASSIDEFLAHDDPAVPTCFVFHGNRMDARLAIDEGMLAYRQLTIGLPPEQGVRFVIWSWPSDRIHGILNDIRTKALRTNTESMYLAWTLHQLNPNTPVSLVGFSFGARIASGGLHLLAGGSLNGFSLGTAGASRTSVRVVLAAAALHNHWLAEDHYHGEALEVVDSMLLVNNDCDWALKRYRFIDTCLCAEALGYTGMTGHSPHYGKVRQCDACDELGKHHDWQNYLESPGISAMMRQTVWPHLAAPLAAKADAELAASAN
jgi:hypothetical protein